MTRIILFGKNGRLGQRLCCYLDLLGQVTAIDRITCDITDSHALRCLMRRIQPHIIINAAAYTNVDQAESDAALAHWTNAEAVGVLAQLATHYGALFVHYSTDYVFDGQQLTPYLETDRTHPLSVYGKSKLAGEKLVSIYTDRYLIFRTSWLFDSQGRSFPKIILQSAYLNQAIYAVDDEFGVPTATIDVAIATCQVLKQYIQTQEPSLFPYGLYHLSSQGKTSRFDYAQKVLNIAKHHDTQGYVLGHLYPLSTSIQPQRAKRPHTVELATTLFNSTFGIKLPDWMGRLLAVVPQWMREILHDL
ncbi:MAG: dTDP-4-dehydrorhamnose reductase [Neisseriales bacterium]|nr:MAG: dTDP-4-dehydrorhamnose reductase [Neisseriales bacterium]